MLARFRGAAGRTALILFCLSVLAVIAVLFWARTSPPVAALASRLANGGAGADTKLVYSELRGASSVIWEAPVGNPKGKKQLAVVPHLPGYGIKASISPAGESVAFKVLGVESSGSTSRASLWLLSLKEGRTRLLQEDVELAGVPVWSSSGVMVAVVRSYDAESGRVVAILSIDAGTGESAQLFASGKEDWLSPIGWSKDEKTFYYASVAGPYIYFNSLNIQDGLPSAPPQKLDGIARDFRLSPDTGVLAYTSLERVDQELRASVKLIQVSDTDSPGGLKEYPASVSPVWRAAKDALTFASLTRGSVQSAARVNWEVASQSDTLIFSNPPKGTFYIPLAWSPDGALLATRRLSGRSLDEAKEERLGVLDEHGPSTGSGQALFQPADTSGYAEFIGWRP